MSAAALTAARGALLSSACWLVRPCQRSGSGSLGAWPSTLSQGQSHAEHRVHSMTMRGCPGTAPKINIQKCVWPDSLGSAGENRYP